MGVGTREDTGEDRGGEVHSLDYGDTGAGLHTVGLVGFTGCLVGLVGIVPPSPSPSIYVSLTVCLIF